MIKFITIGVVIFSLAVALISGLHYVDHLPRNKQNIVYSTVVIFACILHYFTGEPLMTLKLLYEH